MSGSVGRRPAIPWWIKASYTLWVLVLVPIWIQVQGPQNFLWLSDIALLGTCIAIWLKSRLLLSTMAIGGVLPELGWTLMFLGRLAVDAGPLEQTGYMFDERLPLFVRGLSLYHAFLPPLLIWLVCRLGYDRRGLAVQTALAAVVLLLTRSLSGPADNINFAYGFGDPPQPPVPPPLWFAAQMLILFCGAYLPIHFLLTRCAPLRQPHEGRPAATDPTRSG